MVTLAYPGHCVGCDRNHKADAKFKENQRSLKKGRFTSLASCAASQEKRALKSKKRFIVTYHFVRLHWRAVADAVIDRHAHRKCHALLDLLAVLALTFVHDRRLGIDGVISSAANVDNLGTNDTLNDYRGKRVVARLEKRLSVG